MKYIRQFFIILLVTFFGELLSRAIPAPIPAGIYGLIILFLCLETGLIKHDSVKDAGHFLIEIMPVMFVPAGAGLIQSWDIVKDSWLAYLIVSVVSTVAVMAVSGLVAQKLAVKEEHKDE